MDATKTADVDMKLNNAKGKVSKHGKCNRGEQK
jgi:hypothetical protein